jgi:hypothetical protein
MATEVEIDRALPVVTATLNDHGLGCFDARRGQQIVTAALGGEPSLTVDDGGGPSSRRSGHRAPRQRRPS